jgi:hypothetical protein
VKTDVVYLDKNPEPLEIGSKVSVRHCVGLYGQCATVSGELVSIDQCSGVRIRVDDECVEDRGRLGTRHLKPGDETYIAGVFCPDKGVQVGYRKHEDFEHGHEVWIQRTME